VIGAAGFREASILGSGVVDSVGNGARRPLPELHSTKPPICFGPFEFDSERGQLRKHGIRIKLQDQPFQILQILLERSGELVTREELRNRIWPADTFVDFDKGLYNAVKKLREALGDTAGTPRYVETVPKRGYRFIAPIRDQAPMTVLVESRPAEEALAATTPERGGLARRLLRWKVAVPSVCLFLIAIAGAGLWMTRPARAPLNERDTIVLADFSNSTGETVFDDALKQGLDVDLQQSRFLNILPEDAISRELRFMGRPLETRLTPDVAREVCQRANGRAALLGSISPLGGHYVITLRAVECADGNSLDVEQVEADRRESVLAKLHEAGKRLRNKLGESLSSIQKNDTPLVQATTSSLEALQVYSQAGKLARSQGESAAVPFFKHALELDPGFALAYSDLGTMYCNLGKTGLCASYVSKAYELRDRTTEKERFYIDSNYYMLATGELDKAAGVFKQWKQEYPRDLVPYVNLGAIATNFGQLEAALNNDLEGVHLNSESLVVLRNLSYDYMNLNRLDDARQVLEQARSHKMDQALLPNFYQLAFLRADEREMARCLGAAEEDTATEPTLLSSQADSEASNGHLAKAREYSRRAVDLSLTADAKEDAAGWEAAEAFREAEFGNSERALRSAKDALMLSSARNVRIAVALVFARAGDRQQAERLASDLEKSFPLDTLLIRYWLPTIRAAVHLAAKDPSLALVDLSVTAPYELGGNDSALASGATMYPVYLRGLAYLDIREWQRSAAEFNKILDHRGLVSNFPLEAFAHLQLARAHAGAGDSVKAKAAYQDFLSLWQTADLDVPVRQRAAAEYAKLK
jgi:eukaryotic-like serine/threonine-protein kinase